jgi:hypothetical protein
MSYNKLLVLARGLRDRGAELLLKADAMSDPDAMSQMREVATRYEQLAQRIEEESDDADNA